MLMPFAAADKHNIVYGKNFRITVITDRLIRLNGTKTGSLKIVKHWRPSTGIWENVIFP